MKKIIYYRTKSLGGEEGKTFITRNFETPELAKKNALEDTWNDYFTLYEVTLTFDGVVNESERKLGRIPCYREIVHEQLMKEQAKAKSR